MLWVFGRGKSAVMVVAIKLAIVTYYPEPSGTHKTLEDQSPSLVNQTDIVSLNNPPIFQAVAIGMILGGSPTSELNNIESQRDPCFNLAITIKKNGSVWSYDA